MYSLTRTEAPDKDVLDFEAVAEWCRLIEGAEDDEPGLTDLLAVSIEHFEDLTGKSLLTQEWKLTLDRWPCSGVIRLPRGPLWLSDPEDPDTFEVEIVYVDSAGVERTLAAANYQVDVDSMPPRIVPAYGTVWPALRCQPNAVRITYSTGRDDPDDVSQTARLGVRMLFAHFHENREPIVTGTIVATLPMHLQQLIANETVPHFDPDE